MIIQPGPVVVIKVIMKRIAVPNIVQEHLNVQVKVRVKRPLALVRVKEIGRASIVQPLTSHAHLLVKTGDLATDKKVRVCALITGVAPHVQYHRLPDVLGHHNAMVMVLV